jgi:hypothetical protein
MARKLEVELNAKSNADVVFGRAQRAASKFAGEIGQRVMGAIAPMVLFDKGMGLITGSIDKYADANARARKLGVPFSEFFKLSEALEDAGISEETTAKAVKEMSIVLAEAQGGAENQTKALKDLGYTQDQISKGAIDVVDLFMRLADATKAARSEAERNNVVLTILGKKTGPELANALSAGSAELKKNMAGASTATDELGERAEKTRIYWNNLKDDMAFGGMMILKTLQDMTTSIGRQNLMTETLNTATQAKLEDAKASEILAKSLLATGKVQEKTNEQMQKELATGGELVQFYKDWAAGIAKSSPEAGAKAKALTDQVIADAQKILDLRKQAADVQSKPEFQQFNATTMQALGGGYANARVGGSMNQPIGAMTGTTPMLPSTTSPTTPAEQIFQDIRSLVNTINGKIETPSTNQTNKSFRLTP